MRTEAEIQKYLENQGYSFTRPTRGGVQVLRVMDKSQLPASMREQFDERGFFLAPEQQHEPAEEKK
jgi:hypothetical protein